MKNRLRWGTILIFSGLTAQIHAQEVAPLANNDKVFSHYVGLQGNLLLRQILSFDDVSDVNNPYLLKYTLRHNASGWALNLAGGVQFDESETDNGFISSTESYDFRAGPGHIWQWGKLEVGIGADIIWSRSYAATTALNIVTINNQTDSTITRTRVRNQAFGGGLQASLNFMLTPHIAIGTEASWYFTTSEAKENVEEDNYFNFPGSPPLRTLVVENLSTDGKRFETILPVAIFILIKF